MSAKLSIKQRILAGLVLAVAFLLVLATNLVDRRHFSTIQHAVASIHDDRVVAQNFIYQLRNILHESELEVVENGTFLIDTEGEIGSILDDFASTDLTREEAEFLRRLREQFIGLTPSDVHITNTGYINDKEQLIIQIDGIKKTLDSLEEIQLEESGQLTKLSEKSLKVNMMLSNLEVGFLIVIAVSILMLVFQPIKTLYPIR
ncbi:MULTISPECIES: hypothetical protein [unclassified Allomuricauda]|jgi:hypothetical protein|uniref:hypothetical protein n=1 Tax=Flavobacteriaceae TaxID=49546 RepID=UPI001B1FF6E3|nr:MULTISPECIES: hypothetical protein [unclassified Allomuricauda]MBO6830450.1 hypothetical protein [Allomuricauda sp.]